MATYDGWKLRSDLDELEQPEPEQLDDCGTCGGVESHDRACPDRDDVDPVRDYFEEGWS